MKSLLRFVFLGSAAFSAFQVFGHPMLNAFATEDRYQITWEGAASQPLYGSYVIGSAGSVGQPDRVEKVVAQLPHTVSFSAKNAIVSASGVTPTSNDVTIKIYKNGRECGKVTAIGSGAIPSKVCQ